MSPARSAPRDALRRGNIGDGFLTVRNDGFGATRDHALMCTLLVVEVCLFIVSKSPHPTTPLRDHLMLCVQEPPVAHDDLEEHALRSDAWYARYW